MSLSSDDIKAIDGNVVPKEIASLIRFEIIHPILWRWRLEKTAAAMAAGKMIFEFARSEAQASA